MNRSKITVLTLCCIVAQSTSASESHKRAITKYAMRVPGRQSTKSPELSEHEIARMVEIENNKRKRDSSKSAFTFEPRGEIVGATLAETNSGKGSRRRK